MKDLQALSKQTGIPEYRFKEALGIPLEPCAATTVDEAAEAYHDTPEDSEAEGAALQRWHELSLAAVRAVTTFTEAQEVYSSAPTNSKAQQVALEKMAEFSLAEVRAATTVDEAMEAYDKTLENSEAELAAIKKIYDLF